MMKYHYQHPRLLPSIRSLLLICLPAAVWVVSTAAADVAPAPAPRPSCLSRCGDVDIPYPFGIGHGCAIHGGFVLNCSAVNGTEMRPFAGPFEVTSISLPDAKASLKMDITWQCFDNQMNRTSYTSGGNFTNTPYRFSTEDKIFVIGCNSLAYITSEYYTIGCLSECYGDPRNTSSCSSGAGCCEADVPADMGTYQHYFNPDHNSTGCSYSVVMEAKAFSYSTTYRQSPAAFWDAYNGRVPVVFDWVIRPYTCEDAKTNFISSYACVSQKSECVDTTNRQQGYSCKCMDGYQGNPYVTDGCTDIDECLQNTTTDACTAIGAICQNAPGNFSCICPPGKELMNNICIAKHKSSSPGVSIGIGVSSGVFLMLLVLLGAIITRKHKQLKTKRLKQRFFTQNRGQLLQQLVAQRADIAERMIIPLEELEKATNNFDKARKLGDGGHSIVYKGILSDLHVVAIKKSKTTIQKESDEFINEVAILSQISHINVVKLFGCCLETEVPLLVYEFVSNGTLYHHLHVMEPKSLSWNDRLRIATETAKAVAYLHSAVSFPIIHRDIKSTNILLDETLTAKVSDFGASRHIPLFNQTGVTTRVQGTIGYLDPSYYYTRRLTDKSDVYSFGVVLVELLTRKKPFSYVSSEQEGLVTHFTGMLSLGRLVEILDWQVTEEGGKQVEEVATLAAICVKLNPDERPTMRQVEMELEAIQANERVLENVAGVKIDNAIRRSHPEGRNIHDMTTRQYSLEEEFLLSSRYPR